MYTILKVGDRDVPGRVEFAFQLKGGILRADGEFPSGEHVENGTPGTFPDYALQIGQFQFVDGTFAAGDRVTFTIAQGNFAPYATDLEAA